MESLPVKVLPYLLGSRYCEVDRLCDMAWKIFDQTPRGWGRVQAVCDWVHDHVRFGYEYARSTKSAYEVYTEGTGVCRDFAPAGNYLVSLFEHPGSICCWLSW